jgi:phosphopantothenoylcysteine decarboxylase/phosphopantothenate--cysteine ligase
VQVIMTANAARFITPLTLATLSGRPVRVDEFPESIGTPGESIDPVAHIRLAEQADAYVVAPATANTIAKIALGIADNLLTSTVLAWRGPCVIAPAMNYKMYEAEATQANLAVLAKRGWTAVDPEEGWLACGDVGRGRLASPERIATAVLAALAQKGGELAGKRILVTAGGTREAIDPVRFVSNASSGTLALKCAMKLALQGAAVELICGTGVDERMLGEIPCALLMLAAVADYAPAPAPNKIKKEDSAKLSLSLARTEDILQGLPDAPGLVKIGVSLETDDAAARAAAKLKAKRLDAIVAVDYRAGESPYGENSIRAGLISAGGEGLPIEPRPKDELAGAIAHLTTTLIKLKETA